jgi:IS30 family transposase
VRGAKTWAKGVTGISQRPAEARYRQVLGHWEADTMLGTKSGAMARLLVSVERASRYTRLALLSDAAPQTVVKQLRRSLLANKKPWAVKSLTTDRGGEFAQLPGLLGKRFFVCDPYNPNQRGTNENTIGLIRQYIPKGQPLTLQTPASVRRLERALNSRPRACLGFKTPAEVLLA